MTANASATTTDGNPYWAPVNFSDWNETKAGGVTCFVLWFSGIIIWVVAGWCVLAKRKQKFIEEEFKQGYEVVSASTDNMFGFLPIGTHFVSRNQSVRSHVKVTRIRCCRCPHRRQVMFDLGDANMNVQSRVCSVFNIVMALIMGFAFAFFAHFVPCVWWTCDWGYYDGEQIRGYIWFIGWPSFSTFFFILGAVCQYLKIDVRPSQGNLATETIWVSIGNNHVIVANNYNLSKIDSDESLRIVNSNESNIANDAKLGETAKSESQTVNSG